jgi:hypothetical protein
MRKVIEIIIVLILLCFYAVPALPAEVEKKSNIYALIVSGISKDTQDKITRALEVSELQRFLKEKNQAESETIKILAADTARNNTANSSQLANIEKIMIQFESAISSMDRFVFYYTGQANVVENQLRFNLPGEDMTQDQLALLLKNIKASSILIVLDCPASGLAVKELSGTGRIIICSCTEEQRYSSRLGEFFVPALSKSETDIDKDGRISVLEAFISASKQVEEWYQKKQLIITETPVLDDNGDGRASKEPWRYMLDVKDGLMSAEFFF